ncbi:nitronate monooxygenase [Halanaerobacter jeridensis]|uniref:Probable nitronate monooxygenase n=1 Tax=Halanaerobacter jeridensis TaxID=706427 RepID=A0A938XXP6_9FIRM|nr:nitronate monooxygenase [Halanaerobacter jeridensis]MBM7557567.1 enoyl-[acyl-carrier protein] reductase II [Halanaerobacter jeridensis]
MQTKLTELLGIEYPIVQGAMAWVADGELAAAVSEAGGAGTIAAAGREAQWVKNEIQTAEELTDQPFGVNIMLMADNSEQIVDVVCEAGVEYATLGAGNPLPYFEKLHDAGVKVIPVVPNVKLAKRVADNGADAIIIEGMEAGGHIGNLSTMSLMTQVIPEVDIPVIAAGGFADGRGLAAALVMGVSGVQMGTRFYASEECNAHPKAKQEIIAADDTDTVVTGLITGHPVRGINNSLAEKYLELEQKCESLSTLEELVEGTSRIAPQEGDVDWGFVQAGQSLKTIKEIKSCSEIIRTIVNDAGEALSTAQKFI